MARCGELRSQANAATRRDALDEMPNIAFAGTYRLSRSANRGSVGHSAGRGAVAPLPGRSIARTWTSGLGSTPHGVATKSGEPRTTFVAVLPLEQAEGEELGLGRWDTRVPVGRKCVGRRRCNLRDHVAPSQVFWGSGP